jgi:hypothetical protein
MPEDKDLVLLGIALDVEQMRDELSSLAAALKASAKEGGAGE